MEGHRFFDLVRWGIAHTVLNEYLNIEKQNRSYLQQAYFERNKDEYAPIPQSVIDMAGKDENGEPLMIQNPGY